MHHPFGSELMKARARDIDTSVERAHQRRATPWHGQRKRLGRSGIASISYPTNAVTVPVSGPISASTTVPERPTLAVATLQSNVPGLHVSAAVLNSTKDTLTIYLNKAPGTAKAPRTANVGWVLVN